MGNGYNSGRQPRRAPAREENGRGEPRNAERKPQVRKPQKQSGMVQLHGRALRLYNKEKSWEQGEKHIERINRGLDRPMLAIIFVILCLGTIMVFSASFPSAYLDHDGNSMYYLQRQIVFAVIGIAGMFILSCFPYNLYKKLTPSLYILAIVLLLVVLVIGTSRGVAQRWIRVGGFTFQPSEVGKIAVVMMLAWYFDKNYDKIRARRTKKETILFGVIYPAVIFGIICGLVLLERHLSGTIIIAMIAVCVIFLGGAHVGYLAGIYAAAGALLGTVYLATNSYAFQRILTHLDENADALAEDWQTTQGIYAIGSGGLLGVGLGDSRLKYNYVSEPQNDFIFTIWCEEMGFVGAAIVVLLYCAFVWRGFVIAKKAPDTFTSLVAFGITCQVGIQAFLNMMVVCDLIPNTGISLPFFSYGGSALIILLWEMGILLGISRHSYQKK